MKSFKAGTIIKYKDLFGELYFCYKVLFVGINFVIMIKLQGFKIGINTCVDTRYLPQGFSNPNNYELIKENNESW